MSLDRELAFETEICESLAAHGWLYVEGDAQRYDRARALFPSDVLDFVQTTQPNEWAALTKSHGAKAAEVLLSRLRAQLDQRGTLSVLRQGIDLLGLKQTLKLAEFRPALGINPDILARYAQNRLRVVRQVHHSLNNAQDAVDLVLAERPDVVVIASSDSDFAPLVHRLREKGCVVRGIGDYLSEVRDELRDNAAA